MKGPRDCEHRGVQTSQGKKGVIPVVSTKKDRCKTIEETVHMRHIAVTLIIGVNGQEIGVYGFDVTALGSGKHGFEGVEPPAVPFEGIQLS